jgi:SAM-dependent methyltransferase
VSARLAAQTEALAALGAWLHLRSTGARAVPEIDRALDEVLSALGLGVALEAASPSELVAVLSPIRAVFLQAVDLISDPGRAPGWSHTDADILESFGRTSAGFARVLQERVAPQLDGLAERLDAPDAAFLDVGCGVAALAIAMAEQWPRLQVVGIDPWEPSLALARANVRAAGLEHRVALRNLGVEDLADEDAFDLAFLPGPFLPRLALEAALGRIRQALRPGGWAMIGLYRGQDALDEALARLRATRSGGSSPTPAEAVRLLRTAGFEGTAEFVAELGIPSALAVGRRP